MIPGDYLEALQVARDGGMEPEDKAERLAKLLGLGRDGRAILLEAVNIDWCGTCRHRYEAAR